MKAKLRVELTIRIDEPEIKFSQLRDVARKYLSKGEFTINDIGVTTNFRDEVAQDEPDKKHE